MNRKHTLVSVKKKKKKKKHVNRCEGAENILWTGVNRRGIYVNRCEPWFALTESLGLPQFYFKRNLHLHPFKIPQALRTSLPVAAPRLSQILTMSHLYALIEQAQHLKVQVTMSYLEVYNETIRDLLVLEPQGLSLREDPVKGCAIPWLYSSSYLLNSFCLYAT
jgi:hypothetical protein